MEFLYPGYLWALTILAIPIVIHLFHFRKYKKYYFSSLNFIRKVDEENKSTRKIKHFLILISRLLAFIFLVLAFAQPYFPKNGNDSKLADEIVAFYIDNSYSMQSRGSEGELLSEALEKAREIIEKSSVNTRFLIGTNEMNGIDEHFLSKLEALEKIDAITYSSISGAYEKIIEWQSEVLKLEATNKSSIRYILLSDFQKIPKKNSLNTDLSHLDIYPIKLIAEKQKNLYIDSVWFSSPIRKTGNKNEFFIRLVNKSDVLLTNVELIYTIGKMKKTVFMDIEANSKKETSISYQDNKPDYIDGQVRVFDEHILFDDAFYFSYNVRDEANVLIINGEDQISNFSTVYGLDKYYHLTEKEATSITLEDFNGKDLVVINGMNSIPGGTAVYFKNFVKNGGSIALFPGKNAVIPEWNSILEDLSLPILTGVISSGTKIKSLNYKDPFFTGVFEKETKNLNLPAVKTIYTTNKMNADASDVILLQNGLSLLSYSHTSGHAFMFYSSVHPDFGSITENALYSTILLRMGELSQRPLPLYLTLGEDARFPVYQKFETESAIHLKNENSDLIPMVSENYGVHFLALNKLQDQSGLSAGNFQIINGNNLLGKLSLNFNRLESNTEYYSEDEIIDKLTKLNATSVHYHEADHSGNLSTINLDKPFAYWKLCIIFTLIFVIAEMLLVRFLK